MNASLSRVSDRLWSAVCKLMMLVVAICAPLHAVQGQTLTDIAIAGGNNQSTYAANGCRMTHRLVLGIVVCYARLDGHRRAEFDTNFQSNYSTFVDTGLNPTFSIGVYSGNTSGPFQVTVNCSSGCTGTTTLTFNETATPPPPYLEMDITDGNNQTGPVGSTLPTPLTVC